MKLLQVLHYQILIDLMGLFCLGLTIGFRSQILILIEDNRPDF